MERLPDPLAPGKTVHWDVDIAKWVEMKEPGTYCVSFTVNGKESNQLRFVKEWESGQMTMAVRKSLTTNAPIVVEPGKKSSC